MAPFLSSGFFRGRPMIGRCLTATFKSGGLAAMVLGMAACSTPGPFLYDPVGYNREDPDFAKPREFREVVTVCYSNYGSEQSEVAAIAANACAEFGAGFRYLGYTYNSCPMMTPVGAQFSCVGAPTPILSRQPSRSTDSRGEGARTGRSNAGQPGTPLSGFHEGDRPMGVLFGRPGSTGDAMPSAMPGAPVPPTAPVSSDTVN